ncbi:Alpha,alpha-trehalose-phosphate synthase [UDP-forming] 2 [Rhizoctonia solani]|uniref:Alpha,alpha-trehalose-phosphate synthase [UDP-forming] 2 n=1 Tax=Rhizoctonia solani TaxID=456999 RepID=A0A0K6G3J7_9AGAM|nr:Alpha,alpha-trehalose-phosphate synthase [UDP-forming] 2 [Rhizoctonia solani]
MVGDGDTKEEFDEYGAELEPEARVWKTYVSVADKFDKEQVDGWNSSLDVTLIFAGIFTAICTAFVIESAKSLKEDPAETAARRLDQITQILLVAHANDSSPLNATEIGAPISPDPFLPRTVDVCINALWFFSLILSAAVALLAMLAKEWCYLFMSGRTGDPWSQTTMRQRRWKGIETWKMEEFIMFLPSFIHLAVLSFAVGLCIYLGDLNWRVAILAVVVTVGSLLVYAASTFLPLLKQRDQLDLIYPYSTSISRLVDRIWKNNKSDQRDDGETTLKQDSEQTGHIALEALSWLIKTREDSNSTDTALQAIAGADPDDKNREILKNSGAHKMVSRRLIALDSYSKNYEQISDLYTRALSFFFQPTQPSPTTSLYDNPTEKSGRREEVPQSTAPTLSPTSLKGEVGGDQASTQQKNLKKRELQKKIRSLRDVINKQITAYTSNRIFLPTTDNIQALSIGSTAASHCLRSLAQGKQTHTQKQFDTAIDLLESYKNGQAHLNEHEIDYLMKGTAMLLTSLLANCTPDAGAQCVLKLIKKADTVEIESGQKQLQLGYLGLPLVVYALSRHDYPPWDEYHLRSREERAIDIVAHYVSCPSEELHHAASTMINLGLLELLSEPEYKLNSKDFKTISEAFDAGDRAHQTRIYTLPSLSNTDIYSRSLTGIIKLISDDQHHLLDDKDTKDVAIACLTVLNRTRLDHWQADASISLGQLYAFVIECVLKIPPSGPEAYGQNSALDLMQEFHNQNHPERIQNLMPDLAYWMNKRDVFTKLKKAARRQGTSSDINEAGRLFATGQAWLLINRAIKSGLVGHEDWRKSLSSFVGSESVSDLGELEEEGNHLAEQFQKEWEQSVALRHPYLRDLYRSVSSVSSKPSSSSATIPLLSPES